MNSTPNGNRISEDKQSPQQMSAEDVTKVLEDQGKFDHFIRRSSEMLDCPGRLVVLDWRMERLLREAAVFETRQGLATDHAVQVFDQGRRGHSTFVGLERWRLDFDDQSFSMVKLHDGLGQILPDPSLDVWVVPVDRHKILYRHLRKLSREDSEEEAPPPVMREEDKDRLWENTVGFLLRGDDQLKRYGVPQKRGVLLIGSPGNGKTMACRWLYGECMRRRVNWRCVTTDQYDMARSHGATSNLFSIASPGVILFDDLDLGMRSREESGPSREHSVLLAELDGVQQREGVVYLFTTNMKLKELDTAFIRRGRIDQVIQFNKPDGPLRKQMITEFWHEDIVQGLDIDQVVRETADRSFADLAELKKLLVLRFIDTQQWDWDWAWKTFQTSDEPDRPRRRIGFANSRHNRRDWDEDYDPMYDPMTAEEIPY